MHISHRDNHMIVVIARLTFGKRTLQSEIWYRRHFSFFSIKKKDKREKSVRYTLSQIGYNYFSVVYKYGKALQQNVRSHISGVVLIKINFMLFYEIMRKNETKKWSYG